MDAALSKKLLPHTQLLDYHITVNVVSLYETLKSLGYHSEIL